MMSRPTLPPSSDSRGLWSRIHRIGVIRLLVACGLGLVELSVMVLFMAWLAGAIWSDGALWSQWLHWIPSLAVMAGLMGGLVASSLRMVILRRSRRRRRTSAIVWLAPLAGVFIVFAAVEHRLWRMTPEKPDQAFTIAHWTADPANGDTAWRPALERLADLGADLTIIGDTFISRRSQLLDPLVEANEWTWRIGPFVAATDLPVLRHRYLVATDGIWIVRLELDAKASLGRPLAIDLVDLPSELTRPRAEIAADVRRLLGEADVDPPDLVIGDFNMTRGSASLREAFPGMGHGFSSGGHGYAATFHRDWPLPLYHIDHVLMSRDFTCPRYDIIDFGIGRHLVQRAWIEGAAQRNSESESEGGQTRAE